MLRNPLLVPDLRELIHAGETAALRDFFADQHPGHVAEIIEDLGEEEGDATLALLPDRLRASVMSYVDPERQVRVVEAMAPDEAAALLHLMPHDDRADLVNRLDEARVDQILRHLAQAEREDIRRLASFEEGTAGSVMTTDYATLTPDLTVHDAIARLRHEAPDRETIDYSFVVDPQHKLLGIVPLKRLIMASPRTRSTRSCSATRSSPGSTRTRSRSRGRSTSTTCSPSPSSTPRTCSSGSSPTTTRWTSSAASRRRTSSSSAASRPTPRPTTPPTGRAGSSASSAAGCRGC